MFFKYLNTSTFPKDDDTNTPHDSSSLGNVEQKAESFTEDFVLKMDTAMRDIVLEDNVDYSESNSDFSTFNDSNMLRNNLSNYSSIVSGHNNNNSVSNVTVYKTRLNVSSEVNNSNSFSNVNKSKFGYFSSLNDSEFPSNNK